MSVRATTHAFILFAAAFCACVTQAAEPFHLQETTIDDIHRGIRAGEVTYKQVVQAKAPYAAAKI